MIRFAMRIIALLMLIIALTALWASLFYTTKAQLISNGPGRAYFFSAQRGSLQIWTQEISPVPSPPMLVMLTRPGEIKAILGTPGGSQNLFAQNFGTDQRGDSPLGFKWGRQYVRATMYPAGTAVPFASGMRFIVVPWWLIILVGLLPSAIYAAMWIRRRRRVTTGMCAACGYDLRASPERCPECGAIPQPLA